MSDREVVIKISAKNLTSEEFAKARKEVAGLGDEIAKQGSGNQDATNKWKDFKTAVSDVGETMMKAGAIVGAAIGAAAVGLEKLGSRGADVNDIRDNFTLLNQKIGNDSVAALATLRKSVDDTVSKFDLMQITNKALSQGLRVSNDDFKLLGESSRVLADRIGGDTKEAYETLMEAMASGQTRRLKEIGLNIDETQAIKDHATALGVDASHLNEHGQKLAKQEAIMAALTQVMQENGRATIDFGDAVAKSKVAVANWVDDLGSAIANSKVLGGALDSAGEIIQAVFGSDNSSLIDTIVGLIEQGAFITIEFGRTAVSAGDLVARTFHGLEVVFNAVAGGVAALAGGFFNLISIVATAGTYIPLVGKSFETDAKSAGELATQLKGMANGFFEAGGKALEATVGVRDSNDIFNRLDRSLVSVRDRMINAKAATDDHTKSTKKSNEAVDEQGQTVGMTSEEIKKAREAVRKLESGFFGLTESVGQASEVELNHVKVSMELFKALSTVEQTAHIANFGFKGMADGLENVGQKIHDLGPDIQHQFVGPMLEGAKNVQTFGQKVKGALGDIDTLLSNIPGKFAEIGAVAARTGQAIIKNLGEGNVFGAVVAGAVGAFQAIKSLFRGVSQEELTGRKAVQDFEQQLSSLLSKTQKVEAGNAQWKMTTIAVRDAYVATGRSEAEAEAAVKRLWDSSKKGAAETEAAIKAINEAFAEQKQDQADLEAAIKEYGFTIDELGPKMRKQQLTEQAVKLENQWRLLVQSGIDVGVVTDRMSDKLNEYVQMSIKTGTEVPAEMRPIIERMAEMGKLTDENGKKLDATALDGITWSETMTQGFDRIVKGLKDVVAALGGVKDGVNSIPTDHTTTVTTVHRDVYEREGEPPEFATEAYVRRPTLAMIGDVAGGEFVLKPSTIEKLRRQAFNDGVEAASSSGVTAVSMTALENKLDQGNNELRKLRADIRGMPRSTAIAVRDGMLAAR